MKEIGELLRSERELRGLSIKEVHEATKISPRFLRALEAGEFEVIPGEVYLRGFLRSYAALLGLDPEAILGRYDAFRAREKAERRLRRSDRRKAQAEIRRVRSKRLLGPVLLAILLVAFGAGVYHLSMDVSIEGPEPSQLPGAQPAVRDEMTGKIAPESTPGEEATPEIEPPKNYQVRVEVLERCWVRAVSDGRVILERTLESGENAVFPYKEELILRVGNAGGIRVFVDGKEVGTLGERGQVVEKRFSANFSGEGLERSRKMANQGE